MKIFAISALALMCSCATIGPLAADILKTCGAPAAEAEAAQLYKTVLALVENQPVNMTEQLEALEANFKTGVLCALQQIANNQFSASAPGAMVAFNPTPQAVANARAFLATHKG